MKKILIVYDEIGWAFWNHALQIQKRLSNEFIIDIADHRKNILELSENYALAYIMDPMPLRNGYPPKEKTILGLRADFFWRENPEGAKGTYEKGYRCQPIKGKCSIFHTINQKSYEAFKPFVEEKLILCQHGVDETVFDKQKYVRPPHDGLIVGISGRVNSPNKKGFDIVDSACKKMGIKYLTTKYQGGIRLTKEQMPSFYNSIDCYCCMSLTEGLNNPSLEAGSFSIPCISTKSGAAEEMIQDGVNGLLINRDEKSLMEAIEKMKDEKKRLEMGEAFYKEIMQNWTWAKKINEYRDMFELFFKMFP